MIQLADLHTHSTASDGQYTPAQLVRLAGEKGLEVLALTDHDTVDGLDEAVRAGQEQGIRVLRGIELSAREYPTYHILGYNIAPDDPGLTRLCEEMRRGRDERSVRIIAFLKEKGVELSLAEVEELAGGRVVGRPHFAQALLRRRYVSTSREAFDRYLDTKEYQTRVERPRPPVRTCVETIKGAGGAACLAHPYQIGVDGERLEELVRELKGYGLDAIECWYPRYTPEQQALYLRLAKKYGLHTTGGSDFHGERVKPDISLARVELELDWLEE